MDGWIQTSRSRHQARHSNTQALTGRGSMDQDAKPLPSPAELWPSIEEVLNLALLKSESISNQRLMETYTQVYNICTANNVNNNEPESHLHHFHQFKGISSGGSNALYEMLRGYLIRYATKLKEEAEDMDGEVLLRFLAERWKKFSFVAQKLIDFVFKYINKQYVIEVKENDSFAHNHSGSTTPTGMSTENISALHVDETCRTITCKVASLAMVVWRDEIFLPLKDSVIPSLRAMIMRDRKKEEVDYFLISETTKCLITIGFSAQDPNGVCLDIFDTHFVKPFLKETTEYYTGECNRLLAESPIMECLRRFAVFMEEERARAAHYLHPTTESKLQDVCKETLLSAHIDEYNAEFATLLKDEREEDLALMYDMLSKVGRLETLQSHLEKHIVADGGQLIEKIYSEENGSDAKKDDKEKDKKDLFPQIYTDCLLNLHRKYSQLVNKNFKGNSSFIEALDKGCRAIVNKNAVTIAAKKTEKSPELIAKYCDMLLQKTSKKSDEELEVALRDVMTVFKYVEAKDVFQTYYSRLLAKRLANDNSLSDDSESSMISKLKETCGMDYTTKLQRMWQDIVGISKKLNDDYKERMKDSGTPVPFDFHINVLTSGAWPYSESKEPFRLPEVLSAGLAKFSMFYTAQHTGRKLKLLVKESKGEIKTNYLKRNLLVGVSLYQIAILLCFNDRLEVSVSTLADKTELEKSFLVSHLEYILKTKLLTVKGGTKLDESSVLCLNTSLNLKKTRFNINKQIKKEKEKEQSDVELSIKADRQHVIQACIVRIMKMRKTLKHTDLCNEAMTQLSNRFKPQISMVKKQINVLIEKEYLCRNQDARDVYNYMA